MLFRVILFCCLFCFAQLVFAQLQPGPQVATFFSDVDDTDQPYGLYLPDNFEPNKKYPLVIMLHGAGSNHRLALRRVFGKSNSNGETDVEATRYFPEWKNVDYIVASPFARGTVGYQGIAEKDVYDVLNDVKKRFRIDEDRIYLTGLSMGGGGTLWIGLTRPDIWAALAPVCPAPPPGTDQYQSNAIHLPIHFFHGDQDSAVPVTVSREWVKKIKELGGKVQYAEYPGVNHNSWENAYKDGFIFSWFDHFKRNSFPDHVQFSTAQYKYSQAYWIRVNGITPATTATVNAKFLGVNQLEVNVANATAFTVKLAGHPKYQQGKPLLFSLNGKKMKMAASDSLSFHLSGDKWTAGMPNKSGLFKKPGAEGPIAEAFAQRHIYVYGTAGNPSPEQLKERIAIATQAANWSVYRGEFLGRVMIFPRVVADKDVRPSDLKDSNLILFGTREDNTLIGRYADQLPIHLGPDQSDLSLFYVFPIGNRYVAINSGLPWWTSGQRAASSFTPLSTAGLNKLPDFVLFRDSSANIVVQGYFDSNWKLSADQIEKLQANKVTVKQ